MAGIGSEAPQSLQTGSTAQPLVSTPAGVVTPSAVQQLVDSFRNGGITAQEIIDRIGPVGQAKRKAELQSLNEFTSPTGVNARQTALQAATARAQLEQQQASAGQTLVQPQTDLALAKTQRDIAENKWGGGVSAYQQYAPYFGEPAMIPDANGNPDYDAMGAAGNKYMRTMAQQNFARMMLEPDPSRKVEGTDEQGRPVQKWFNKWGQEVTPGSPSYNNLQNVIQDTNSQIFGGKPGQVSTDTGTPSAPAAPATPPTGSNLIEGKSGDELRAELVNNGMTGSQAANTSDADAAKLVASLQPTAPAPAAKPAVGFGSYQPGSGLITGPGKNFMTSKEIGDDLRKQKSYELWDQQKGFANSFETTVKKIDSIPQAEQQSGKAKMNALDIALAESIIKMYDPGMAIREFKWDKLAEAQPLLEKLPNWRADFLHTGALTPQGRQRLIEMGYDNIQGKDQAVRPHIEQAAQRAQQMGTSPSTVLNGEEMRVLNKQPFSNRTPAAAAPSGKTVTIPGLGTGIFDPRTGTFTRTQ